MARISIVRPIVQFSSRGLRNAPVRNAGPHVDNQYGEDVGRPVVHLADETAGTSKEMSTVDL